MGNRHAYERKVMSYVNDNVRFKLGQKHHGQAVFPNKTVV